MSAFGIRCIASACVAVGVFIDAANQPDDVMQATQFIIIAVLLLILAEARS